MTAERCPRCQGRMMPDREDGTRCFSCGHTPPPAVLLGIPDGSIDARAEVARFESELPPGMNRWRDLKKQRLTGPRHNNSRL